MWYLIVMAVLVLVGCDDPVEPHELGPYAVETLRAVPEGTEVSFVDLNENGQALWYEGEQAVLWDDGSVLEVPVGRFLGSSGEVVGESSVWIEGALTELPGSTRGITEHGTVYFSRNDSMFTWRDGGLEFVDFPIGLVGPGGRVWNHRTFQYHESCRYWTDESSYVYVASGSICRVHMAEENGWALVKGDGLLDLNVGSYYRDQSVVVPAMYQILDDEGRSRNLAHVNSEGHAVATVGIVGEPDGTRLDLRDHFEGTIRLGAINDDGEILAQLDDEIVLLTPR